ncbi:MAG: hypothetical protein GU356_11065 [Pyrobaculum sp.]|nr:hypothetical protein [Pyrobaculum sp.]
MSYLVYERKIKAEVYGDHVMLPKSSKVEEGGLSAARWVAAALVVMTLFVVSTAAQRVYVYEVESDVAITEDVPYVPGISWRFGEQLLVVWVPRDIEPGILLSVGSGLVDRLLSRAFDMGFDVYVRWNVPLIAFIDVSSLYISCRVVKHLLAYVRRRG